MANPMKGGAGYTVIEETVEVEKPRRKNIIERPAGFEFDSDELAENGQLVTVRVKEDEDGLCVVELEGIPLKGEDSDDEEEYDEYD